jgi:hypothetical protein
LPSPRRRKRDYRKGKVWVTRTLSRCGNTNLRGIHRGIYSGCVV